MSKNIKNRFSLVRQLIINRARPISSQFNNFVTARPLVSFVILIAILFGLLVLSNLLRKPEATAEVAEAKTVDTAVYIVGEAPELVVQAQVEKTGIIRLVALSGGVVQKLHVEAGQSVARGTKIVSLSSNYQGGNIATLSRQLSQKSYQSAVDNYQLQVKSIDASKQLAEKGETQTTTLRELSRYSWDETRRLIDLNEDIFDYTEDLLDQAIANNAPQTEIIALKGQLAGQLSALSNLRTGLRSSEYLNSDTEEAAELGRISRDNTFRQLELQRRALDLSRDVALLNLKIAQVGESLMYPTSPCAGTVERVFVQVGQVVNPGTPLAIIKADDSEVSAIALVSSEVARQLSPLSASTIAVGEQEVSVVPQAIASEPTDGTLHAITYSLPTQVTNLVSQGNAVTIKVPVGLKNTSLAVPLDAVFQSQDQAYVLITKTNDQGWQAESRVVQLGEIVGSMVIITDGLSAGDQVILNRQVMAGDRVEIQ